MTNSSETTSTPTTPTISSPSFDDSPLLSLLAMSPTEMSPDDLKAFISELRRCRQAVTLRAKVTARRTATGNDPANEKLPKADVTAKAAAIRELLGL